MPGFPKPAGAAKPDAGGSPGLSDDAVDDAAEEAAEDAAEKDAGEVAREDGEPGSSSTTAPCAAAEAPAGAGCPVKPAAGRSRTGGFENAGAADPRPGASEGPPFAGAALPAGTALRGAAGAGGTSGCAAVTDAAPGESAGTVGPAGLASGDEGLAEGFCGARPSETLHPPAAKSAGSREAKDGGVALASACAAVAGGGGAAGRGVAVPDSGQPEDEAEPAAVASGVSPAGEEPLAAEAVAREKGSGRQALDQAGKPDGTAEAVCPVASGETSAARFAASAVVAGCARGWFGPDGDAGDAGEAATVAGMLGAIVDVLVGVLVDVMVGPPERGSADGAPGSASDPAVATETASAAGCARACCEGVQESDSSGLASVAAGAEAERAGAPLAEALAADPARGLTAWAAGAAGAAGAALPCSEACRTSENVATARSGALPAGCAGGVRCAGLVSGLAIDFALEASTMESAAFPAGPRQPGDHSVPKRMAFNWRENRGLRRE